MKKENKEFIQKTDPSSPLETDYLENENVSRPKKDYQGLYMFLAFLLLLGFLGIGYYFYTNRNASDYSTFNPNASITEKLNYNPNYLEEEKLLIIKGLSTIEYLRTRLLYYKYETDENPTKSLQEELQRDFNGERAQVLVDILKNLTKFEDEKQKIDVNSELSQYKKYIKSKAVRVEIFGEELEPVLFPEKPEERMEAFFLYSKQYLKNHLEDDPISKRDHLTKAKKEIYGEFFEDLQVREPIPAKLELELGIIEREMSILSEPERKAKIDSIRDKLRKGEL
jgi:hypothetical protein